MPIATGNQNSSLLALVNGKWVNLVVPYPMGFFTKWVEGRIDDANAGWKGRGLWATTSTRTMFHLEGGKDEPSEGGEIPDAARSAGEVTIAGSDSGPWRRVRPRPVSSTQSDMSETEDPGEGTT